jgi:hypothetical protein
MSFQAAIRILCTESVRYKMRYVLTLESSSHSTTTIAAKLFPTRRPIVNNVLSTVIQSRSNSQSHDVLPAPFICARNTSPFSHTRLPRFSSRPFRPSRVKDNSLPRSVTDIYDANGTTNLPYSRSLHAPGLHSHEEKARYTLLIRRHVSIHCVSVVHVPLIT